MESEKSKRKSSEFTWLSLKFVTLAIGSCQIVVTLCIAVLSIFLQFAWEKNYDKSTATAMTSILCLQTVTCMINVVAGIILILGVKQENLPKLQVWIQIEGISILLLIVKITLVCILIVYPTYLLVQDILGILLVSCSVQTVYLYRNQILSTTILMTS